MFHFVKNIWSWSKQRIMIGRLY